ncbi:MAG: hypothetical protein OEZ16_11190, partial [Chromatiales bacterium]|nr:hypothetical protein [Chromatiales bacterium]
PAHGKIICISRNSPHRSFAEFQTKKQLLLIDESMMRLELEEIRQLARLISNNELNDESVERLYDKTRGWAAGLVLLIDDPELLASGVGHSGDGYNVIFDYFSSEFESKWNDELKQFLFNTALLPRMTRATATAMVGGVNVSAIIDSLMRRNYFISRYHGEVSGYQYHPLFQEFLLRKLVEVVPEDEVRALRDKAARLMLDEGYISEAIEIFAGNQQWDDVIASILSNVQTFSKKGRTVTIAGWLSHIPDKVIESEPWLNYWKGYCEMQFSPTKAIPYAQAAFDMFCQNSDKLAVALSWSLLLETRLSSWDNLSDINIIFDKYDEVVGADFVYPSADLEMLVMISGLSIATFRDLDRCVYDKWYERSVNLLSRMVSANDKCILAGRILYSGCWFGGSAELFEDVVEMMDRELAKESDINIISRIWCYTALSIYYSFTGRHADAVEKITQAYDLSKSSGVMILIPVITTLANMVAIICGDQDAAKMWQSENEATTSREDLYSTALMHMAKGYTLLSAGEPGNATVHAQQGVSMIRRSGFNRSSVLSMTVLMSGYIELGEYDKAEQCYNEMLDFNKRFRSHNISFSIAWMKSWLFYEQGDIDRFLASFSEALNNVDVDNDLLAMYPWRPSVLSRLCWLAFDANTKIDNVSRLITRYKIPHPFSEKKLANWPWQCKITTLGGFSVEVNGETVPAKKLKSKPWDILKVLVVMGGRNVPIDEIADMLWPESDGDTASSAFSTNLQRLRVQLGNDDFLIVKDRTISINDSLVFVDVDVL